MRLILLFAACSLAAAADHPDLNGTWQNASTGETITIRTTDDAVQIAQTGKEGTNIQCHTDGEACKIKGGQVSAWYNGGMLVVMETTHGSNRVVKKRFKPAADGGLEEEVIHITPAGGTEKWILGRKSGS